MTKNVAKTEKPRRERHRHHPTTRTSSHGLERFLIVVCMVVIDIWGSTIVELV